MSKNKVKRIGFTLNRLKPIGLEHGQTKRIFIYDTKVDGLRVLASATGVTTFQFYK